MAMVLPLLYWTCIFLLTTCQAQTSPKPGDNIEYQNHYDVLQIEKSASTSDIKKAYRKLAVQWHPDKHSKEDEKEQATKIFQAIGRAYEVLSDDTKRQQFDDDLYFGKAGQDQYRDPRDRGNIWEQLRRERLRKQQAHANSWSGQFNNMLNYIIPMFLAFGAYRAYSSGALDPSSPTPASGTNGGGTSTGTGTSNTNTNTNTNNTDTNTAGTGNEDETTKRSGTKSTHAKQALLVAPSLVQLSSLHFDLSSFLVVFAVRGAPDENIPWEHLNTLAKERRSERRLAFAWVDVDTEKEFAAKLSAWHPGVINANDWTVLACRPTKNKVVCYEETADVDFERVGRWLDGLTDGSTALKKIEI